MAFPASDFCSVIFGPAPLLRPKGEKISKKKKIGLKWVQTCAKPRFIEIEIEKRRFLIEKKNRPQVQDLEGTDRGPRRGVPEVWIWKGQIGGPRGGCPWRSGFGRGGSVVPEGGAPGGQDLEGVFFDLLLLFPLKLLLRARCNFDRIGGMPILERKWMPFETPG